MSFFIILKIKYVSKYLIVLNFYADCDSFFSVKVGLTSASKQKEKIGSEISAPKAVLTLNGKIKFGKSCRELSNTEVSFTIYESLRDNEVFL